MQLTPALLSGSAALVQGLQRLQPRVLAQVLAQKLNERQLAGAALVDWPWDYCSARQIDGLLRGERRQKRGQP